MTKEDIHTLLSFLCKLGELQVKDWNVTRHYNKNKK